MRFESLHRSGIDLVSILPGQDENYLRQRALSGLWEKHGKRAGHAKPITDVAYSGDLLITKDVSSMRLWRAHGGDYALLRVLTCRGRHVGVHRSGQFIVTGTREAAAIVPSGDAVEENAAASSVSGGNRAAAATTVLKVWGPGGGSAFTVGKKSITTGVA
jgi:hypothetical protein